MAEVVWILIVFALYFAVLITIAVYRSPRMENMGDYVLGGRRLGGFTAALSAGSSSSSGWTMLVFPALAFTGGLWHLWTMVFIVFGVWVAWVLVAKRLRRYTIATGNSLTIPEFWEKRFGDTTGWLRGLTSLVSLYFITLYVSSGLVAGAKLLEEVFDLDHAGSGHDFAVLVTLVAVLSYTFLGGFMAVSRTDVFQALVMLAGFVIIPVALLIIADNPFSELESGAPGFWSPFTYADGSPLGVLAYLSVLGWGLGALGSQRILARFMAMKDESQIPQATSVSLVWVALMFSFGLLMGLVAAPALEARGVAIPDPERLYLVVSSVFFHPIVGGLLLTGVVAAIMSTADSQLLMASAIASSDAPWLKGITEQVGTAIKVRMGRLLLVTIGGIAALVSILSPESVYALVALAWGGMGAAFGPVTVLALYWRRFNLPGAFAGLISGTLFSTFWWLMDLGVEGARNLTESLGLGAVINNLGDEIWELNPAVPGVVAALIFSVVVSLVTKAPSEEITDLFDEVVSSDWVDPTPREEVPAT
ncbi:MAG: sodium/proline symporter [bacterium]|nr:sodium/proline symporter [bacterium]MDE0643435.1 sodium/proline symporter [bacterium]MYD03564.1 sodium/proline symporter [Acidimicrobiia bacterium]MYH55320.1 sodium/proline symporter [Acidimicrobiia bacterium]